MHTNITKFEQELSNCFEEVKCHGTDQAGFDFQFHVEGEAWLTHGVRVMRLVDTETVIMIGGYGSPMKFFGYNPNEDDNEYEQNQPGFIHRTVKEIEKYYNEHYCSKQNPFPAIKMIDGYEVF
jgi:hypothetical protein